MVVALIGGAVIATLIIVAAMRSTSSYRGEGDTGEASQAVAPGEVRRILEQEFPATGSIPLWFALTNAAIESGFNPRARNDRGRDDSYGLFQLNMLVRGTEEILRNEGLTREDLFNPRTNALLWKKYWVTPFARAARGKGFTGDQQWEAVRLRLGGITWDKFNSDVARRIKATFWATARRFRA